MDNVKVTVFRSDNRGTALAQAAAWSVLNGNRFDVVTFVGTKDFVQFFYIDTEDTNADGSQGAS